MNSGIQHFHKIYKTLLVLSVLEITTKSCLVIKDQNRVINRKSVQQNPPFTGYCDLKRKSGSTNLNSKTVCEKDMGRIH